MRHLSGLWRAGAALVAAVILGIACNYGEVTVVEPAALGHGPLTLSIQADPEDTAVARELGWAAGIPGAEVTVSPGNVDTATGPAVAVLQTDNSGSGTVPDLPDGNYLVEVRRLLTSAEMAALAPGEDVVGFMGQAVVGRGRVPLPVPASRRHSVVISEWAFNAGNVPGVGTYSFGGFLELANNADTTVYLDGLVVGEAWAVAEETPAGGACAGSEGATNDPDGVWTHYFDSLPGTGHTYPLAPGATAVIATDAIDHSVIIPDGLDLSHANFEFVGAADVDNPSVPNTIDIGLSPYPFGHGLIFGGQLQSVAFVARPLDVGGLPSTPDHNFVRVPRDHLLDVVALLARFDFAHPLCPHLVHRNFDRYRAQLMEGSARGGFVHSVHRKAAFVRADGRTILQHTRTSNTDFVIGARTPGQLP